jgi:hypothetical protein
MHETLAEQIERAASLMRQGAGLVFWRTLPEFGANGVGMSWVDKRYDREIALQWTEGR